MKIPKTCLLILTDWYKKCGECPKGYNKAFDCQELREANKLKKVVK